MRQLITRIDDELHSRLRRRANAEGRSVNALVTETLAELVRATDSRGALRRRAQAAGRLVLPPTPGRVPSMTDVRRATRGSGDAVSSALSAERAGR